MTTQECDTINSSFNRTQDLAGMAWQFCGLNRDLDWRLETLSDSLDGLEQEFFFGNPEFETAHQINHDAAIDLMHVRLCWIQNKFLEILQQNTEKERAA